MSTDSFDGGSHGPHQWVAVGYETIDHTVWPQSYQSKSGNTVIPIPERSDVRRYIVRACQLCSEVWLQEFDLMKAVV